MREAVGKPGPKAGNRSVSKEGQQKTHGKSGGKSGNGGSLQKPIPCQKARGKTAAGQSRTKLVWIRVRGVLPETQEGL